MSPTSNVSEENVLQDFRQRLADMMSVDPLEVSELAKCVPQEVGIVALSRSQNWESEVRTLPLPPRSALERPWQGKLLPMAHASLEETGLSEAEIQSLVLKYLLQAQTASGADIARQVALPLNILKGLLSQMKQQKLVVYKTISSVDDYLYELTEQGIALGRRCAEHCTYFDAAPVSLKDYAAAVAAQSIHRLKVQPADVRKAFSDLALSDVMLQRVGRAVRSGKGLFLYGAPGNGKTCIAERITKAYGLSIWIPRALNAFGEIIRLYDPSIHVPLPMNEGSGIVESDKIDRGGCASSGPRSSSAAS